MITAWNTIRVHSTWSTSLLPPFYVADGCGRSFVLGMQIGTLKWQWSRSTLGIHICRSALILLYAAAGCGWSLSSVVLGNHAERKRSWDNAAGLTGHYAVSNPIDPDPLYTAEIYMVGLSFLLNASELPHYFNIAIGTAWNKGKSTEIRSVIQRNSPPMRPAFVTPMPFYGDSGADRIVYHGVSHRPGISVQENQV